jgi:hypothetical protein
MELNAGVPTVTTKELGILLALNQGAFRVCKNVHARILATA